MELYKKYYIDRDYEYLDLFVKLNQEYEIEKVLYPGSFVHITPSFVFPHIVYVDSYKKADTFFKDQVVYEFISKKKKYPQEAKVVFHNADYTENFGEKECNFDLLISLYAGFISQACKKYLKIDGLLVANNSHGDAGMASIDGDYEFIAVANHRNKRFSISGKNLDRYFVPKKDITVTKEYLQNIKRGVGYTKTATVYIFRRIR
ncbi:hypothetical protein GF312_17090 [Candidatus Poribacteria bacterium]|nr:hypothetical protein [Candidatus Poribacteria bacterium]